MPHCSLAMKPTSTAAAAAITIINKKLTVMIEIQSLKQNARVSCICPESRKQAMQFIDQTIDETFTVLLCWLNALIKRVTAVINRL